MNAGTISIHGGNAGRSIQTMGSASQGGRNTSSPLIVYTKNIYVGAGAAIDIGTISIPPTVTRWRVIGLAGQTNLGGTSIVLETPLSGGVLTLWDGPNATGNQLTVSTSFATSSFPALGPLASNNPSFFSTSKKIYINRSSDATIPGFVSVYVTIYPFF